MNARLHKRDLFLVLAGVSGLLLKSWLSGSLGTLARSYLGNVAVSFAVYFLVSIAARIRLTPAMRAVLALAMVEIFELADGFGIMANVYDPLDYLANAIGVALACLVDVLLTRIIPANSKIP